MIMDEASTDTPELVQAAKSGHVDGIRCILAKGVAVDCTDVNGMTALMEAAYKGKADACRLLIVRGADVNKSTFEHRYTPLMFAAMSGSLEVARIILEAGANVRAKNAIDRSAAQVAGFIGHSRVACVINLFFPKSMLEYYTIPRGIESNPKLASYLLSACYEFLSSVNIHPVFLLRHLKSNPELLHAHQQIHRLIVILVEKQFKVEHNEVLALKFHMIDSVLKQACGQGPMETLNKQGGEKVNIDSLVKFLLKGRESDGFPVNLEAFLRLSIRDFAYHQSVLLQQMVHSVSTVAVGENPTSLYVICSMILGINGYNPIEFCTTCGDGKSLRKCASCKEVAYCDQSCQQLHWFTHKKHCRVKSK